MSERQVRYVSPSIICVLAVAGVVLTVHTYQPLISKHTPDTTVLSAYSRYPIGHDLLVRTLLS